MAYIIDHRTGSVSVRCRECRVIVPVKESVRVKRPVGEAMMVFDGRPKTRTGGRLGLGGSKKCFPMIKYEQVDVCLECSRKPANITVFAESRGRHKKWRVK